MMNKRLQQVGVLLCVLLAMSGFCATAKAANFSITASTWLGETEVTVKSRFVNEKHTLYLPGNWDITQVYLEIAGQSSIRVGDTVLTSGQKNDLSSCLGLKQRYYNERGRQMSGTLSILHGSELPSIHFTVDSKQLSQVNKSKNNVIEEGNFLYVEANGSISYDGPLASLKGRGNSTFAYSKKPYQVKLPEKVNLSGMGKGKTWLLIANWLDLSLMRNQVMLDLAREVGIPNALSCQMADVYFNGTYNGLYLVTEKIQVGKKRVDIYDLEEATIQANDTPVEGTKRIDETKSEGLAILRAYAIPDDPEDITGGYILEIEKSYRFRDKITNGFRTENGISVTVKEPTYASRAQVMYIGKMFSDFHKAALAKDGYSPDTGKYYADFIDMESFALKWWMEEFSKNYDAYASSQFYYKDVDSVSDKIFAGPVWDYDLSLGNMYADNFVYGTMPDRDYVVTHSTKQDNLYRALYQHEDFREQLTQMYRERVRPAIAEMLGLTDDGENQVLQTFDGYMDAMDASAQMNFTRWPESLVSGYYKKSGQTHAQSATYLKNYMLKRLAYLDSVWLEKEN